MPDTNRFHYETPHDSDNELTIVPFDEEPEWKQYSDKRNISGGIEISVGDEKAVDSYNAHFECSIYLDRKAAIALRDWLNKRYP